jgi:hypothetical protein
MAGAAAVSGAAGTVAAVARFSGGQSDVVNAAAEVAPGPSSSGAVPDLAERVAQAPGGIPAPPAAPGIGAAAQALEVDLRRDVLAKELAGLDPPRDPLVRASSAAAGGVIPDVKLGPALADQDIEPLPLPEVPPPDLDVAGASETAGAVENAAEETSDANDVAKK